MQSATPLTHRISLYVQAVKTLSSKFCSIHQTTSKRYLIRSVSTLFSYAYVLGCFNNLHFYLTVIPIFSTTISSLFLLELLSIKERTSQQVSKTNLLINNFIKITINTKEILPTLLKRVKPCYPSIRITVGQTLSADGK